MKQPQTCPAKYWDSVPSSSTWKPNWNSIKRSRTSLFVAAGAGKSQTVQVITKPLSGSLFLFRFICRERPCWQVIEVVHMAVWRPRARDSLEGMEEARQRLSRQALSLNRASMEWWQIPRRSWLPVRFQSWIYGKWSLQHNTFSHPYSCPLGHMVSL